MVADACHVGKVVDHRTSDSFVRDCCRMLPVDERLAFAFFTLAVPAIALDVTFLLAVEALLVLVPPCQLLQK